ncbi:MAG: MerR family transcriptional regulator [Pseudomonadota bacterium]
MLRIGDLARLGGVSVKALRFYDEQGLLRPEHVDPHTGYRYYALDQAKTLAVITNLRMIDFTIAEIATILKEGEASPDRLQDTIASKRRELQDIKSKLASKLQLADMMAQSLEDEAAAALPTFKLAPLKDQSVYAIRKTVPYLGAPVTEMFEAAESIVADRDARAPTAPFMMFHSAPTEKSNLDLEVCIPLSTDSPDHPPATHIPGSAMACSVVYAGGYFKTEILFEQMTGWVSGAGLKAAGPLRELYHRFGADQDAYRLPAKMIAADRSEFLTELQIPVSLPQPNMEPPR